MPVHAAVLTLRPGDTAPTLQQLTTMPWLTLGEATGDRIPVVADPPDRDADRILWRSLERVPGIANIELVFSEFSDLTQEEVSS